MAVNLTYCTKSFVPSFIFTDSEIAQLMANNSELSDQEFFDYFDKKINNAFIHLNLLAENWEDLIISELIADSYSCSVKIAHVLQLITDYQDRIIPMLINYRHDINYQYMEKLSDLCDKLDDIVVKYDTLTKKNEVFIGLKKTKMAKVMNLIVLPRFIERAYQLNSKILDESDAEKKDKITHSILNKVVNEQIKAGYKVIDTTSILNQIAPGSWSKYGSDYVHTALECLSHFHESVETDLFVIQYPTALCWLLLIMIFASDVFSEEEEYRKLAFVNSIDIVKNNDNFKRKVTAEKNKYTFSTDKKELSKEDYKEIIKTIKNRINQGIGQIYINNIDNIPEFVRQLRDSKCTRGEADALIEEIALLDYFRKKLEEIEKIYSMHPLVSYICRGDKVKEVLDWLHRHIIGQKTAKQQIAPIKAAMECKPKAVNDTLPVEVFNQEFGLTIAKDTWENWTRSYHSRVYTEGDLKDYKDELQEIMN